MSARTALAVLVGAALLWAGDLEERGEVRQLIERRNLARAEELVVRHLSTKGRTPEWILLLAEIRFDQHRFTESLQLQDGARQLGDFSYRNHLLAGLNYVALNRNDLAEPELRAAVKLDSSSAMALYYLGRLLYAKNTFDEAISVTKAALALDPSLVRAYDNLGLSYEAVQKKAEAEQAYLEGIRLQRLSGATIEWPALNMGTMLVKRGEFARGKVLLEEALKINPKSAEAHFRLGSVLDHDKDFAGAVLEYKEALACDPNLNGAYYRLAQVYQRIGKRTEAKQLIQIFQQRSKKQASP